MPLPLPNLDDRRWSDLVDEGRALVPRYAPGWTDHNVHDPGITLIELFAWLAELDVYGVNRVTARHRRKFLALLGLPPAPPHPAQTMIALTPPGGASPFPLPAGLEFDARDVSNALVPVRTLRSITVAAVTLAALQVDEGTGPVDRTRDARDGLPVRPFGADPKPGAAWYLGFAAIPTETPLTLAMRWDRPGASAAERATESADERARLIAEAAAQRRACRPVLPDIPCPGSIAPTAPAASLPPHHSVRLVWETFTGTWTRLDPVTPPAVPGIGQIADDTRALTLDGVVELNLPPTVVATTVGTVATPLVYLRCRLDSGAYDAPPVLLDVFANAVPAEQSVPLAQRLEIPAAVTPVGTAMPGVLTRVRLSLDARERIQSLAFDPAAPGLPDVMVLGYEKSAGADGSLILQMVHAGTGSGLPGQSMTLPASPIALDDALAVFSHDGVAWQPWTLRPDTDASTRGDWHCVLDPTTGVLTFGDGERGRTVPAGHEVMVTARATLGAAGNVDARTLVGLRASAKNEAVLALLAPAVAAVVRGAAATNPWPASGGSDAETLDHAAGRAAEILHAHARLTALAADERSQTFDQVDREKVRALPAPTSNAIDLLDLERLAVDVPGTRVARARAWANTHPDYPCLSAPGSVTIVIVPEMPVARPQPSAGLLEAVRRYLDRRRMVTTQLHVVGPRYLEVSVTAQVRPLPGASAGALVPRIVKALDAWLDPRTGGPNGLGWPFGRDIYRSEILQLIDGVPGVDHVLDLSLSAPGLAPQCGNLGVCAGWLAAPGPHQIVVA